MEGKKTRNKGTLAIQILIECLECKDIEWKVPRLNQYEGGNGILEFG